MRFLGFWLGDRTADENTIRHFGNRMTETGTLKRAMNDFEWRLHRERVAVTGSRRHANGYIPMSGPLFSLQRNGTAQPLFSNQAKSFAEHFLSIPCLATRNCRNIPLIGTQMKLIHSAAAAVLICALGTAPAMAVCNISDAQLEEAILKKPELRAPQNRQIVLDLRALRDAAYLLWTYKMEEDCERLIGNIRELIAAPSLASIGTNDADAADQQLAAGEPQWHRLGQIQGNRGKAGEAALISIDDLDPGLLANELIGAEVRTSDDMIVGEVRNIVIGTKDRWDYVIVASGGFFVPGKDSLVVPLRYLVVDKERQSFFLRISNEQVKSVPLMPDQEYLWLEEDAWRARNDAIFRNLLGEAPN